jgi:hypothetical protein
VSGDQVNAVRRKVEAWLTEPDAGSAIALKARPEWTDEPVLHIGGAAVRVVPCPTPLAMRAALHDRTATEKLALLTELNDDQVGAGLLAHLSRNTVRSIDPWDLVRQMFGNVDLDPTLVRTGRWVAAALNDFAPADGWPRPAGKVLTRDHALRCLAGQLLGVDGQQLDSAGLLQWSADAPAVLRFRDVPEDIGDGVSEFLAEIAGPAAVPIMTAVRRGHGVDALPAGLLVGVLWPATSATDPVAVSGRVRLEPRIGQVNDRQTTALREAAEAWLDRVQDSDIHEAHRLLMRAEALASEIKVTELLGGSPILPSGFTHRLRALAAAVRAAVPAGTQADQAAVAKAQSLLEAVAEHRSADPGRVETARMAVRLLRWLSIVDDAAPTTLYEALLRQVRVDGWVDRARLDVFAGDPDPQVAETYQLLHRAVDARRARHDQQFATLLASSTAADAQPGALLRVEDVLDSVVRPILDRGRRVLLLVMDGMSVAAATELAESLTRNGSWLELTPGGGARVGVLAALPTITEVSRCSLLSGRIAVGTQPQERAAFAKQFPDGLLLHKAALRAGAGSALDPEVTAALADPARPLVAAVVNTIDDALDRSDPGTIVWSNETIVAVRDLLSLAQDRVVVLVSDHGHVVDRGPEAVQRSVGTSENRWRPATGPAAGDDELLVAGPRVAKAGGRVVLPWREELRYGPRKAGYHGGAAPAEAVIPLVVLSAGVEDAVPGWAGAPVASPDWWREAVPAPPVAPAPAPRRTPAKSTPPAQSEALFEVEPVAAPLAPPAAVSTQPALVDSLLASETYQARRRPSRALPDDRVAALLRVLLDNGGRATKETMAARAGIPAFRINGIITELTRLLAVEGYPVLTVDPDEVTVKLDVKLLKDQFQL